jgi:hypothetical protein
LTAPSHLLERLSTQEQQNADLMTFRIQALSRLAAQHEEITRLRGQLTDSNKLACATPHQPLNAAQYLLGQHLACAGSL